jgi:hypothetical protein
VLHIPQQCFPTRAPQNIVKVSAWNHGRNKYKFGICKYREKFQMSLVTTWKMLQFFSYTLSSSMYVTSLYKQTVLTTISSNWTALPATRFSCPVDVFIIPGYEKLFKAFAMEKMWIALHWSIRVLFSHITILPWTSSEMSNSGFSKQCWRTRLPGCYVLSTSTVTEVSKKRSASIFGINLADGRTTPIHKAGNCLPVDKTRPNVFIMNMVVTFRPLVTQ